MHTHCGLCLGEEQQAEVWHDAVKDRSASRSWENKKHRAELQRGLGLGVLHSRTGGQCPYSIRVLQDRKPVSQHTKEYSIQQAQRPGRSQDTCSAGAACANPAAPLCQELGPCCPETGPGIHIGGCFRGHMRRPRFEHHFQISAQLLKSFLLSKYFKYLNSSS